MCTRAMWPDAAGAVLVGRNMDYGRDLATNLYSYPRGMSRDDRIDGAFTWESEYGSLVTGADDIATVDGINETGLAGHLLWLTESEYGPRDGDRPALGVTVWLQYMLDNFATVAEAVAWVEETRVQIVGLSDPQSGAPVTLHLALDDATGDSASSP